MDLQELAKEIQGLHLAPVISEKPKSQTENFRTYAEIIRDEFKADFCTRTVEIEVTDCSNIYTLEKWLKSHLRGKKISTFGNWIRVEKI